MINLAQPLDLLLCAVNSGRWVYGQIPPPTLGMLARLQRGLAVGRGEVWEDSPFWYEAHCQLKDTVGLAVLHDHTTIALCAAGASGTLHPSGVWGLLCCYAHLSSAEPAYLERPIIPPWLALQTFNEPIQLDVAAACRLQQFFFALPYALSLHHELQSKP